ncbi:DUF1302 family protein [Candidatus Chrysopegis kryptomonas]|uniref:Uncharacterized protein n=1 Tax=Candidatus Chryseopegocella kryptomonas TaxID=1633643 RepID=A0A0N7MX08_9BACT|nr:DUF1302 family protein [Candidatus Chrysopegis kryptomonas]CUT00123.1 hypothetical protein JGI23_00791 [Candidatus Chrysopegis kryptomonas]
MRLKKFIILVLIFFNITNSQNLKIGGYIQADDRLRWKDKKISWEEYRLDLTGEVVLDNVKFYSELWFRNFGSSDANKLFDLIDKDKVEPLNIDLREAYVDVKGFIFENVDLKIGRQRIAWGTADKLNPTDNLNPDDLEDIWDYGRHLGSNSVKLSVYAGNFTFTGVFIPTFTPAVLPRGDWLDIFADEFSFGTDEKQLNLIREKIFIKNPEPTLKDASKFGLKISTNISGFDFSLSYVQGRDDIPILKKVFVSDLTLSSLDSVILIFPKMKIVGFDFAGDLGGVGVWGEAGVFFPEKVVFEYVLYRLGSESIIYSSDILEEKNYTRFVLGMDYSFKNGVYLNMQYLHGFLHERGRGNLRNYLVFNVEKKFFDDKLKFNFLSGGIEFKRLSDVRNNYAFIYNPQISYSPIDNFEFSLGGRLIDGKGRTMFGRIKDRDEVYLRVKYSF